MYHLTRDQLNLQASAAELANAEFASQAAIIDRTEEYPWHGVDQLASGGFMGMTIPKAYGGRGLTYLDVVLVVEQMAKACATMGRISVEANMGAIGAVMAYGSEEQKKRVAPYVQSGDKPTLCLMTFSLVWIIESYLVVF
ncbi:MAG: hypothetical protein GKR96_01755 [Gammaproteobacteria bacterium]|nr:hypothetical protein [Gammaproteobacteria bacterium]